MGCCAVAAGMVRRAAALKAAVRARMVGMTFYISRNEMLDRRIPVGRW